MSDERAGVALDAILDRLLVPRANGTAGLSAAADFIAGTAAANGAQVQRDAFVATPHGFALVWIVCVLLAIAAALALLRGRYGIALLLGLVPSVLLLAEFELLRSPVSGLLPATEENVIATYPGKPGGPTLVFTAHYDTTTHFGDHIIWGEWGALIALGQIVSIAVPLVGLVLRRRRRGLPSWSTRLAATLIIVPPAGMLFMHTLGPLLRTPSPGALDNGGSVAALLRLSERMHARSAGAPTTVQLVFLAAEEERALGSWHDAARLAGAEPQPKAIVNLELVGAGEDLGYIVEDGFAFTRYRSPDAMVENLERAARDVEARALAAANAARGIAHRWSELSRSVAPRGDPDLERLLPAEPPFALRFA